MKDKYVIIKSEYLEYINEEDITNIKVNAINITTLKIMITETTDLLHEKENYSARLKNVLMGLNDGISKYQNEYIEHITNIEKDLTNVSIIINKIIDKRNKLMYLLSSEKYEDKTSDNIDQEIFNNKFFND